MACSLQIVGGGFDVGVSVEGLEDALYFEVRDFGGWDADVTGSAVFDWRVFSEGDVASDTEPGEKCFGVLVGAGGLLVFGEGEMPDVDCCGGVHFCFSERSCFGGNVLNLE